MSPPEKVKNHCLGPVQVQTTRTDFMSLDDGWGIVSDLKIYSQKQFLSVFDHISAHNILYISKSDIVKWIIICFVIVLHSVILPAQIRPRSVITDFDKNEFTSWSILKTGPSASCTAIIDSQTVCDPSRGRRSLWMHEKLGNYLTLWKVEMEIHRSIVFLHT